MTENEELPSRRWGVGLEGDHFFGRPGGGVISPPPFPPLFLYPFPFPVYFRKTQATASFLALINVVCHGQFL